MHNNTQYILVKFIIFIIHLFYLVIMQTAVKTLLLNLFNVTDIIFSFFSHKINLF